MTTENGYEMEISFVGATNEAEVAFLRHHLEEQGWTLVDWEFSGPGGEQTYIRDTPFTSVDAGQLITYTAKSGLVLYHLEHYTDGGAAAPHYFLWKARPELNPVEGAML